jgi:hypothetical protein
MLVAIMLAYAVIIGLDQHPAGGASRVLLLGFLVWDVLRIRPGRPLWVGRTVGAASVLQLLATITVQAAAPAPVSSGVVGGLSLVLAAWVMAMVGSAVLARRTVDTPTVLGVLGVYLLLALAFASMHQLFAAFDPDHYLNGVTGLPTSSDQLYFSVITLATVGFGDITPASQLARAVTVVEALTGQLYLVSVVAAVVGGWHRRSRE